MNGFYRWLFVFFLLPSLVQAQTTRYTDPNASNDHPVAPLNDGSYFCDTTYGYPRTFLVDLPYQLRENSGMISYAGGLWMHNDSGGLPEIYKVDPVTGKILQTVSLANARNVDWEDIAQDTLFLYVGDIGNNRGARRDLCIYRIAKSSIVPKQYSEVNAEKIAFCYGDQSDFVPRNRAHNFDCEALLSTGDSLYLFTKNWSDGQTRVYAMPAHPGDYTVFPVDEFNVDGLVTGADRDPATGNVSLVGYKDFVSFLWLLFDYPGNRFFAGNKRRIELPDFVYVQTEGVTFYNGDLLLISCEESSVPPGVYQLNTASWTGSSEPGRNRGPEGSIRLEEMQSEKINQFIFSVLSLPESILKIEIYDQDWIKQENEPARIFYDMRDSTLSLDMHAFPRGTYFLRLISGEEQHVVKIFVE